MPTLAGAGAQPRDARGADGHELPRYQHDSDRAERSRLRADVDSGRDDDEHLSGGSGAAVAATPMTAPAPFLLTPGVGEAGSAAATAQQTFAQLTAADAGSALNVADILSELLRVVGQIFQLYTDFVYQLFEPILNFLQDPVGNTFQLIIDFLTNPGPTLVTFGSVPVRRCLPGGLVGRCVADLSAAAAAAVAGDHAGVVGGYFLQRVPQQAAAARTRACPRARTCARPAGAVARAETTPPLTSVAPTVPTCTGGADRVGERRLCARRCPARPRRGRCGALRDQRRRSRRRFHADAAGGHRRQGARVRHRGVRGRCCCGVVAGQAQGAAPQAGAADPPAPIRRRVHGLRARPRRSSARAGATAAA